MSDDRTVVALLEQACSTYPDHPAFTCLGRTLTYAELDRLSGWFAAYLQQETDLQPGDRIAVQLPNTLQYPVVMFGALRAGMILVNTNPLYTAREMTHQYNDAGARLLVTLSAMADKARAVMSETGIESLITTDPTDLHPALEQIGSHRPAAVDGSVLSLIDALVMGSRQVLSPSAADPADIALLQYTGGTTGVAKGAMLSHRNLVANTRQMTTHSAAFFNEGRETYIACLPLYHIYAFTIHCIALPHKGGHSVLIPNPRDIPQVVEAVAPHRFTGFPGINTLFGALCRDEQFRQLDFSALKSSSSGGMALTREVSDAWHQLTGVRIAEGYGMSETSPVIASNPPGQVQLGTIGRPVPDTEVRVIDSEGTVLPQGEAGELCVRGPQVMSGYWQRPEATAEVLSGDGWLRTGDIAVIQPDGYLRLVDRLKDMIVVSGFNVYPNEVEAVACSFPGVIECAAISVPDDKTGEAVKLFVVAGQADFDIGALREFLRTQLTPYKVPAHIVCIDELPKSNVGKVLRRELRDVTNA